MTVRVEFNTGTFNAPVWTDITQFVRSVSVARGKDELLEGFSAGNANIVLDNRDRRFDPLFAASPYAGDILPRRQVRVFSDYNPAGTTTTIVNLTNNPNAQYVTSASNLRDWTYSISAGAVQRTILPISPSGFAALVADADTGLGVARAKPSTLTVPIVPGQFYSASARVQAVVIDPPFPGPVSVQLVWEGASGDVGQPVPLVQTELGFASLSDYRAQTQAPAGATTFRMEFTRDRLGSADTTFRVWNLMLQAGLRYSAPFDGNTVRSGGIYSWLGSRDGDQSQAVLDLPTTNVFTGFIDDWDLNYELSGDNTAVIRASDAFTLFANQQIADQTMPIEPTGVRISRLLSQTGINYAGDARNIQAGVKFLGTDVTDGDSALAYFQKVELSELGQLFVAKNGDLTFLDASQNNPQIADSVATFADDGTGIPFTSLEVVYGSEQLTNVLTVNWPGGAQSATDQDSINAYGVAALTVDTLNQNATDAGYLADYYTTRFGEPQYRVDSLKVTVPSLSSGDRTTALGLELGDVVTVKFTPGGVAPQIVQYAKIVRINSTITDAATRYDVEFGLETFSTFPMVLNDAEYGKLNDDYVLGF